MATPEENLAYLEAVATTARRGSAAAATAMARYISDRAANRTLARASHSEGSWHRTKGGEPPARGSGKLAKGMIYVPASQGTVERATAYVKNTVNYSRILEFGCVIQPTSKKFLHWVDSGGSWYHTFLISPPHPFVEPTTDEAIDDGDLQDEAVEAFIEYDP
jgi:hypothetical protein